VIPVWLRCAHLDNPLGVAPGRVRFGWQLRDSGGGPSQAAFQIQVFPNELLSLSQDAVVWDSGEVASGECSDIPYGGAVLAPGGRYWWRVRVWSPSGAVSAWSSPGTFEVELDPVSGWQASWVGLGQVRESFTPPSGDGAFDPVAESLRPAPYLRRSFAVDKPVASARLHVTALGLYEARLNGQRVGDAHLSPGWTDYDRRVLYQSYDVTSLVSAGENVLGAVIADGWYAGFVGFNAKRAGAHYGPAPELLAQLVLYFADGSREVIGTDASWRGQFAAVRHADLLMGERHDLSLEPAGWDAAGFASADGAWRPVLTRELDGRPLSADPGPPIRVTEEIAAARVWRDAAGRQLADFGQNLTGWVRLRVDVPAGTVITVRHGETLDDGFLYTLNLRSARATDSYVVAGAGPVVLEPRFTLHGFRYAEISGVDVDLPSADVTARVAHSDIPAAGSFASSEPWLDELFRVVDWGQRGNFISVPTDCPQRDERLGWLGDAQIFARTACYNRDVAAFYAKWLDDVADAQHPSGAYPDIAPRLSIPWAGAPAWADAGVIVPWTMWKMYGDRTVLGRHFGAMSRWMDYVARGNPDYLRSTELGNSYNDWLAPVDDHTPPALLATAYWAHDAALMAEISTVLGHADDSAEYRALREKIGSAFADAFVGADGSVVSGTQTAYTLALHMGLVPPALRSSAASHLVAAIEAADWHLTTGFVGVGYLLPVLSSAGRDDVAYRLLAQRSLPSWRYMLDHGATTIWERWDGWSGERGFQSAWMNSFNHYSLGSVAEWLYRFLLGIDQAPGTSGFGQLELRPHPGGSLTWAHGSYQSVRGLVRAGWEVSGSLFSYQVSLPPNVSATVHVPSASAGSVRDGSGGSPVSVGHFPGSIGVEEAIFHVGPGTHSFSGPVPLMLDQEERP
jgi:alpha-L-rhamnosidase